jgi:hypothetical protein
MPVLVDAISKCLLALFRDKIKVVHDDDFLFRFDHAAGLAEYLHVGPVVTDSLLVQVVDIHHILVEVARVVVFAVVLANDGVHHARFS